tara:strand:- start:921 stop:1616 length:696 start_codon:yes stop_codon:yes gene_type:complete
MDKESLEKAWREWASFAGYSNEFPEGRVSLTHGQIAQAAAVEKYCGIPDTIIEIGPNNGMLAKTLLDKFGDKISRYVLVDGDEPLEWARKTLSEYNQIEYVTPPEIPDIKGTFGLFITCHCLPETPVVYQKFIYDTFFSRCNKLFIWQTMSGTLGVRVAQDIEKVNLKKRKALGLIRFIDVNLLTEYINSNFPGFKLISHDEEITLPNLNDDSPIIIANKKISKKTYWKFI